MLLCPNNGAGSENSLATSDTLIGTPVSTCRKAKTSLTGTWDPTTAPRFAGLRRHNDPASPNRTTRRKSYSVEAKHSVQLSVPLGHDTATSLAR